MKPMKKDVKVWPNKVIEGGAIVTTNLIWGEKWRKSLFEGAVVSGLTNIELTPEFSAKLGAAYGSTLPKDSFILAGRDAVRASRMLKRSFLGGLLSAGINVRDIKMVSLPVLRYKLTTFGEVGGVHFRQSPEDPAATEIIFFDAEGIEVSSAAAKGIERVYYKENFRRVHFSEPGGISELPRIYDYYREGYLRALDGAALRAAAPTVVVDLNHSPAGELLPGLLNELGCEVIELNSHLQESRSGTSPEQAERALEQLSRIVVTLGATAGFWIGPSGERLKLIDETGTVLSDIEALAALASLVCQAERSGSLVLPVPAPLAVEERAVAAGLTVKRTKTDGRSLVEAAKERHVQLAAALDGRFAFPAFQPNFDALFAVGKTIELLVSTGKSLGEVRRSAPTRAYRHLQLPCSWELKGGIMRKMSEDSVDLEASFIDGVKVQLPGGWALVLPDQHRPMVHVVAEATDVARADELLETYRHKVEEWKKELIKRLKAGFIGLGERQMAMGLNPLPPFALSRKGFALSELRWDPLKMSWVIITNNGNRRPRDFYRERERVVMTACPFCFGQEEKTTREIFAIREPGSRPTPPAGGSGWSPTSTRPCASKGNWRNGEWGSTTP
jgi:mannose-1-phosphate guanylyltransferase / phosphomannomutase